MHLNFEFKARARDLAALEQNLKALDPVYKGEDHQVDTYFNVPEGRLKLRQGNIENALIFYRRENTAGPKQSDVFLYQHAPDNTLKDILINSLGVKIVVDKIRRIYFIDNVKFHFDQVKGLGSFVEVEAIDLDGQIGIDRLREQCGHYAQLFEIQQDDYIAASYSDLLMQSPS